MSACEAFSKSAEVFVLFHFGLCYFMLRNIEVEGKQNSLFPEGPVIKCFVIPPNSNIGKKLRKYDLYEGQSRRAVLRKLHHGYSLFLRS